MLEFARLLFLPLYGVAMLALVWACLAASATGRGRRDAPVWLALAAFCLVLLTFRYLGGEESVRQSARAIARGSHWYEDRARWQAPLSALFVVLGAATATVALTGWRRLQGSRSRRFRFAASCAMLALLPLYAARLVSYHPIDVILRAGPVPLGWMAEGTCVAVAVYCALRYRREALRYPLDPSRQP